MDSIKNFIKDCLIFNPLFTSEIFYTDTNPTIIESIDVKKIDSKIMRLKDVKTFELKKFKCKIDEIKTTIDKELFDVIKSSQQTISVEYYPKGLFKMFKKEDSHNLLLKCQNYNWSVCSSNISKKLNDLETFIDNSLTNELFVGTTDSLNIILRNQFLIIGDIIEFELLIYNKNIRKIILE